MGPVLARVADIVRQTGQPLQRIHGLEVAPRAFDDGPAGLPVRAATAERLGRFLFTWGVVFAASLAAYAYPILRTPHPASHARRATFPGAALATQVAAAWRVRFGGALPFVGGNVWPAGNVSFFSPGRPPVYIDLDPARSPWIDEAELRRRGAVVLWDDRDVEAIRFRSELALRFPAAEVQPSLGLAWTEPPFQLGWAIVPPALHRSCRSGAHPYPGAASSLSARLD